MKIKTLILISVLSLLFSTSCFEDRDDNGVYANEINDFVWKGMNAVYLYKSNIPDLADERFSSNEEYGAYLNSFETPESLFESLIYDRLNVDKYSWITDDYIALEQLLDGQGFTSGLKYGLRFYPDGSSQVYGYVRYILENSTADTQGLERGMIFNKVDGVSLYYNSSTDNNLGLLSGDNYTLNLASYDNNGTSDTSDDSIVSNSDSANLSTEFIQENPIYNTQIFDIGGEKIGYLMYNRFNNDYHEELNTVFSEFAANNVEHLVLDVRYNPGGKITTTAILGSMITGQFNGQTFSKLQYNSNFEDQLYPFVNEIENGSSINSLNLNKVYIIATGSSASASEAIINSLKEYITVEHIGTATEGKTQASLTIYDSEDLGRQGANPNHTYALQPLIANSVNKNDGIVPSTGLVPTIELEEDITNLGVIGDENEPLLARALSEIAGENKYIPYTKPIKLLGDDNSFNKWAKGFYIDTPPKLKRLKISE